MPKDFSFNFRKKPTEDKPEEKSSMPMMDKGEDKEKKSSFGGGSKVKPYPVDATCMDCKHMQDDKCPNSKVEMGADYEPSMMMCKEFEQKGQEPNGQLAGDESNPFPSA